MSFKITISSYPPLFSIVVSSHPISSSLSLCPISGGWTNMDRGDGYYNGPVIPRGMTLNMTNLPGVEHFALAGAGGGPAFVVAWRAQGWFVNTFSISNDSHATVAAGEPTLRNITWDKGGQQGGRGWQVDGTTGAIYPNPPFFFDNVFEALDLPGEWYHDAADGKLYIFWNATVGTAPPTDMQFVATNLIELVNVTGSSAQPASNITLRGLGFRDGAASYLENWAPPSGGDWALYRGGAIFLQGTEGLTVANCTFTRIDANGILLSGWNRGATLAGNDFSWIGDSAMAGWGYTDDHDGTGGEQPRGTMVLENVCREIGLYQLQSSCWFQAKTAQTSVLRNLFYNGPRAGECTNF
jgi:hypothetical protein